MSHETTGISDEWYTPKYIFDALGVNFDLDVAPASLGLSYVPALRFIEGDGLKKEWAGFVWMNPPFGKRNGIIPWMDKFFKHGQGIALAPDRTGADWWQQCAKKSQAVLFMSPKVKFLRPDGSIGKSPSNGTTLFAAGKKGAEVLYQASSLGVVLTKTKGEQ